MKDCFNCQGRVVDAAQVQWLRGWLSEHADWSRKRLARELCRYWGWCDACGRLKDFAARSYLLKLEARELIALPPLQVHKRRRPRCAPAWPDWQEPAVWTVSLRDLEPVRLERIEAGTSPAQQWAFYLERYHYLGWHLVGENLGYLARDRAGRDLACLLFGAAAWRCRVRDQYLRWSPQERAEGLSRVANNTRFLILPWVRVPGLASHVLGQVVRRINADWHARYGHGLAWLETFVDRQRFAGTCYRAANWCYVGETTGRSRQDRRHRLHVSAKAVYLYRLTR